MKSLWRSFCLLAVIGLCGLSFAQAPQNNSDFTFHKTLHAMAGAGISLGVGAAAQRPWLGLVAGIGAGLAKEGHDKSQGYAFSGRDVLITTGGAAVGYVVNKYVFRVHRQK